MKTDKIPKKALPKIPGWMKRVFENMDLAKAMLERSLLESEGSALDTIWLAEGDLICAHREMRMHLRKHHGKI